MGNTLETMLILHYNDEAEKRHCLSVRWGLLRDLAKGAVECGSLEPLTLEALVQNRYLEPRDGAFTFTDRLYWQAGLSR